MDTQLPNNRDCPCQACIDWRMEPESNGGCFVEYSDEDGGHGRCVWNPDVGCICEGTAKDGECEGCWLWLK